MTGAPWWYLDRRFYSQQARKVFLSKKLAYRHYKRRGQYLGLDPHPLFATDWYKWQNPGWDERAADPFADFILHGAARNADPSFLVDMVTFRRRVATGEPAATVLLRGGLLTEGVYPDLTVLEALQKKFLSAISPVLLQTPKAPTGRRYLVHLQAGGAAAAQRVAGPAERGYDVLVNWYVPGAPGAGLGEYQIFQVGTKFTAAFLVSRHFPWIYRGYSYVLFLDDDIEATPSDIDALFERCEKAGLWLGQASLTQDSYCVWPALFQNTGRGGLRYLNTAEIMMPVLSREAMEICAPHFGDSISGFGLDLLFGRLIADRRRRAIGIVDSVAVRHGKPIDDKGGAFYEFMRKNNINAKAELWRLVSQYGLDIEIRDVRDA